jgi:hypothetical protein
MAAAILTIALLLLLITPEAAWAWGPPTHAFLGSQILGDLAILPPVVRELLSAHPQRFLYGNLSADITQAKEYVEYNRHCHNWAVGFEVLDEADTPGLQAFALGYLSHLAADTIAHNVFVPRQLVSTPHAKKLGHTYWEYRFDTQLGDEYLRLAREIVTHDHAAPDALLEQVLTQPFFSFQTNKRIFQHIIHLSNRDRWNNLWVRMADGSRWGLASETVDRHIELTLAYVRDLLTLGGSSLSQRLDPVGRERLALAKRLRRGHFRAARRETTRDLATAPISTLTLNDATRFFTTRAQTQAMIEHHAEEHFPEPPWPALSADHPDASDVDRFWSAFAYSLA